MRTDVALHITTSHNLNLRHMAANPRAPSRATPIGIRKYPFAFTIDRFRDADTVEGFCRCNACGCTQRITVRLKRIDSFELNSPHDTMAQAYARELTCNWQGKTCYIATSISTRDKYGRTIADVITDTGDLADQLVRAGFAWYGVNSSAPKGFQPAPYSDNSTVPP